MLRRIKAIEIGEQEAGGVPHPSVGIGHPLENFVGHAHFGAIVGRRHPQPQYIRAQ